MNLLGTVCVSDAITIGGFAPFVGARNASEPLAEKETTLLSGIIVSGITNTSASTRKSSTKVERQLRIKKTGFHRITGQHMTIQDIHHPYQLESNKLWSSYRHRKKEGVMLRFWKLDMEKRQQQQNHSK